MFVLNIVIAALSISISLKIDRNFNIHFRTSLPEICLSATILSFYVYLPCIIGYLTLLCLTNGRNYIPANTKHLYNI